MIVVNYFHNGKKKVLSSVYFTYGFSGSGKTYNTKEIIANLLMYIAENHDLIQSIDIRYSELVAATTPDEDVLMSGKEFTGPLSNHQSWNKFETKFGQNNKEDLENYKKEVLPYFYTRDKENTAPLVKTELLTHFLKENSDFITIKPLLDNFDERKADDKQQKYSDSEYKKELIIYQKNKIDRLMLCFDNLLHAQYWFEKFYGYSNQIDEDNPVQPGQEEEVIVSNYDSTQNDKWNLTEILDDKFVSIPEGGTTCNYFKKINLGYNFFQKTALHFNYLPINEWVLINGHMPMKKQTYQDIFEFLESSNDITWNTNLNIATREQKNKIIIKRNALYKNILNKSLTKNDANLNEDIKTNQTQLEKTYLSYFKDAYNQIHTKLNSFMENPLFSGSVTLSKIKPVSFLTKPDQNIAFKIDLAPIRFENKQIQIKLSKEQDSDLQISVAGKNSLTFDCPVIKSKPLLSSLESEYIRKTDAHKIAKQELINILPKGASYSNHTDIMNAVKNLQQFPFGKENINLTDTKPGIAPGQDTYTNPEIYILFKRTLSGEIGGKLTSLDLGLPRDYFVIYPHTIVYNNKRQVVQDNYIGRTNFVQKNFIANGQNDKVKIKTLYPNYYKLFDRKKKSNSSYESCYVTLPRHRLFRS